MLNREKIKLQEKLIQLKDDSIFIKNDVEDLKNNLKNFVNKYQTYRMLGEVIEKGLDDNIINSIERDIHSLSQIQELFVELSKLPEILMEYQLYQENADNIKPIE